MLFAVKENKKFPIVSIEGTSIQKHKNRFIFTFDVYAVNNDKTISDTVLDTFDIDQNGTIYDNYVLENNLAETDLQPVPDRYFHEKAETYHIWEQIKTKYQFR